MASRNGGCELPFTGERVVPGKTPTFQFLEHLIRYRLAGRFVDDAKVLDVACGTGYGSAILAEKANSVVGIDNSFETIQYARQNYPHTNLRYSIADCRHLPFQKGAFDVAVMFEAIEHIAEQNQCLSEIRRVLAPKGVLILSTPNATRPTTVVEEHNPFHFKELSEQEFMELLRPHFPHVQLLYQHELSASHIQPAGGPISGSVKVVEDSASTADAKYFIAVCGVQPARVPLSRTLGVTGIDQQIAIVKDLRHLQVELTAHQQVIKSLRQEIEAHQQEIKAHQKEIRAHQQAIQGLVHQREEIIRDRDQRIAALEKTLRDEIGLRDRQIAEFERKYAASKLELDWLYRWIPVNKLARRFLYGRHLRSRVKAKLGMGS